VNWKYLNTGYGTGSSNMNFDMQLAENCRTDEAFFRLYGWKPFCISLGANQDFYSVDVSKAAEDGIDVVKRPTGGRAILHSEEITYSVVYPLEEKLSLRLLYHKINSALLKGLQIYDERLSQARLENTEPDLNFFYKKDVGQVCFAVSAKNEIKFIGKKFVGSAQRRLNKSVLQHGSILCGPFHKNLIKYLNISENTSVIKEEIDAKTTDLSEILDHEVDYAKLAESLLKGFESYFQSMHGHLKEDSYILNT
jgi:lipoate-protein ligase A